ncbi:multidrug efflux MFS transporter [Clostridium sp. WILCCON 0269]|uniref:Multidrug efflux MFS transporter n=1 Tax=Candidatus Clostridium eludens TaxID=3381663 RepID=A0ABW8SQT6_9CLOT
MKFWKRNLLVCWFTMFVTTMGLSQIVPVLPLYIKQLGVSNTATIEQLSGLAYGITYIVAAFFSPIWGFAADKAGRKPMILRACLGIAIVTFCIGLVRNVSELILLRTLQGAITGVGTACTTLIATQTDKEHAGWALGTLSTGLLAGSLLGPTLGGVIEKFLGLQYVFFITGALCMVAFLISLTFVKEQFVRSDKKALSMKDVWKLIFNPRLTIILFLTFFVLTIALNSIEPIVTVYVSTLMRNTGDVALIAGLTFSASGLASILAAPSIGKASDKIGPHKIIFYGLIIGGIIFIPQAFVKRPWQLMDLRFLFGLATAGLTPAINALVKLITPDQITGRIFGFLMSAQYFGIFGGSFLGGQVAAFFGIRNVFFVTSALLLINAVLVYRSVYKNWSGEMLLKG